MLKIKILSVGKTKETWLEEALNEYIKRLKPIASFEFVWAKNDAQLQELAERESLIVCLDPNGSLMDSGQFSVFLHEKLQEGGSRLAFIIGGPEGLPKSLKQKSQLISLSPLTLTHQLTRLILLEQIYRAFEIARGSKYHK
jgi:23S rRNA (pseudouridine1915-N3)-methyltransferase